MIEYGATGLRQFSGYVRAEWLSDLIGWRGIRMFREMRDNDPVIGAIFFAIESLLRGVKFNMHPADETPESAEAAEFVESCFGDMEQTWPEIISDLLGFMQYGWAVNEIVYKRRSGPSKNPMRDSAFDDGLIGWRKFAPRAQETLLRWDFDESGDATALIQLLPTGGPLLRVPLAKCIHITTRLAKNSPEGVSLLRNCYVPYYFKKRIQEIEAIGIERDLAGLPIMWVPPEWTYPNASADDKAKYASCKKAVRDTTRNEQEGFVFPQMYDEKGNKRLDFTLLSTGGRRQIDTDPIVQRYDHRIAATFLADFLMLSMGGSGGSRGSFAMSKNKTDMFSTAIEFILDLITAEFNRHAIPDILKLNSMEGKCVLVHGDIAKGDILEFAQAVQALTGVGMITPTPQTEATVREEVGLNPLVGDAGQDLRTGGAASEASDVDPAATQSEASDAGQGQGAGANAGGSPMVIPTKPGTAKRRAINKAAWKSPIQKATPNRSAKS